MKKMIVILLAFVLMGCSVGKEKFREYLDNPEFLYKDPHYAEYQKESVDLEHAYLHDEIEYAEYLQRKKELDDKYSKDVQQRESIIHGGR